MPTFSDFSILPTVVFSPQLVYYNDCGEVVVKTKTAKHVCAYVVQ